MGECFEVDAFLQDKKRGILPFIQGFFTLGITEKPWELQESAAPGGGGGMPPKEGSQKDDTKQKI